MRRKSKILIEQYLVKRKSFNEYVACPFSSQIHWNWKMTKTHENCKVTASSKMALSIDQKGMTFDQDFGYALPFFSSLLKKEGRRKGEWIAKIVIKSHAFLLDRLYLNQAPRKYINKISIKLNLESVC